MNEQKIHQPEEEEAILLEDLVPRKDVKGGAGKTVFGQGGDPSEESHLAPETKGRHPAR
jgi:hypothetical protein